MQAGRFERYRRAPNLETAQQQTVLVRTKSLAYRIAFYYRDVCLRLRLINPTIDD